VGLALAKISFAPPNCMSIRLQYISRTALPCAVARNFLESKRERDDDVDQCRAITCSDFRLDWRAHVCVFYRFSEIGR
jgi:hypothetical protein